MGLLHEDHRDIFISYAHADQLFNEVGRNARGWVTAFAASLEERLQRSLTREIKEAGRALDLYWDHKLMGDEPLTEELQDEVEGACIFIALVTDQYLQSDWCRKEYDWFTQVMSQAPAGVDAAILKSGRRSLFVVELEPVGIDLWPGLEGALREPFYYQASTDKPEEIGGRFAYPSPDKLEMVEREYYLGIQKLAGRVAKRIQGFLNPAPEPVELYWERTPAIEIEPEATTGAVALASASDEVAPHAKQVLGRLAALDLGVTVLDGTPFDQLEDRLKAALPGCKAFVQLLDGAPETVSGVASMSRIMMQAKAASRFEVESFYWLPPEHDKDRLVEDGEDYAGFWKKILPKVSQEPDVDAFVAKVRKAFANGGPEAAAPGFAFGPTVDFYVSVSKEDKEIVESMRKELQSISGSSTPFRCFFPMNTEDPGAYYEDWKANILNSDAVILVHGEPKRDWIRDQLIQIAQVISESPKAAQRRNLRLFILDAPPPPPINVVFAGIDVLDCTDGIDAGKLSDVISTLAQEKAAPVAGQGP
ncbi:MAG: toll/interleukin-1 receptor domain-containing protein [Hyphomicrobiales bacterium]|nr:toll/interleukin-1 receptor domain-containing protein [Hyphomicrobiales bacterium]